MGEILGMNFSEIQPRRGVVSTHASIDFETSNWTRPLTWAYVDDEVAVTEDNTKNVEQLLNELFKCIVKYQPKKIWAHNGGKFDWLIVLDYAKVLGLPMRASVKAGRIVFAEIIFGKYRCKLYDSYAVAQAALKKCAVSFQLENAKFLKDDDYKVDALHWGKEKRIAGALADAKCTKELIGKLEEQFVAWGGELKATFSSSALSVLKNYVGGLPKIAERHNIFARESYFGGRVEVFRHAPRFVLNEWDINSSYPYAMTQPLPWKPVSGETELAIIKATVTVPKFDIPVLPFRPPDGGVYFPTGTWRGCFTRAELEYAKSIGAVKKVIVHEQLSYSTAPPQVAEYIQKLYFSKRTAKGAFKEFCKLSLNGSYGKLGQAPEVESLMYFTSEEELNAAVFKYCTPEMKARGYLLQRIHPLEYWHSLAEIKWSPHTNYAAASYVTAYGRMNLHQLMMRADSLCYVDTDSIHANKSSVYETSLELGALKLEKEEIIFAKYYAPKIYKFRTRHAEMVNGKPKRNYYACKGFPVKGKDFQTIVNGRSVSTEPVQLFKSQLRRNSSFRKHGVELPAVNKRWAMTSPKRKLIVDDAEGRTEPWTVEELMSGIHVKQKTFGAK